MKLARTLSLVLMLALSANTLLAAAAVFTNCNGPCCCCLHGQKRLSTTLLSNANPAATCCGLQGSPSCHVSAGNGRQAPPALIQSLSGSPADTVHLFLKIPAAVVSHLTTHSSVTWIDTGPAIPAAPRYLQSCRFIC
jgi:hypothetical protein